MSLKTKIIDLAHNGNGFSKNNSGKATFIPFTIAGEEVLYEVVKENKKYILGQAKKILLKSNSRVDPECKYFTKCGGCNLQHIEISNQRELKLNILKQTLSKQFKITPLEGFELLGKDLPAYNYRNRIKLSVSNTGKIGFLKLSSKEVVKIDECKIADKEVNEALKALSQYTFPKEAKEVFIQQTENGVSILINKISNKNLKKIKANFPKFEITSKSIISSFSQVNNYANEVLKNKVLQLIDDTKVTELYAGSGNFTFELAKKGIEVKAIEVDKKLVCAGEEKIKELNLDRISFLLAKAEDFIKENNISKTLLLDPPRTGAFEVVKRLNCELLEKLVYVSCNPSSLGRDLEILISKGLKIIKIFAVDMFPQTSHLECICLLKKI